MNPILYYEVRVPGNTSYQSEIAEFSEALRIRSEANRICRPGHRIYAVHAHGEVTGPYETP